jgi:tetratricopeptide (TPR) repeat protein
MKTNKYALLILIFLIIGTTQIYPAGAGTTSLNFLKISQGARQSGMGEAFTAIADDVNAIYWNPAGLGQLTRNQVCFQQAFWMVDVNFQYLAYALPIQGLGTFGIYGTFLNAGEITKSIEDALGNPVFTNDIAKASNMNFTAAYGKKFSDFLGPNSAFSDMYAGISLNFSSEQIYNDSGSGFSANIAALYYPRYENFSLGLMVENAGVASNRPDLPLAVKFGFGYRFPFGSVMTSGSDEGYFTFDENDTTAAIDVIYYPEEDIKRINFGAEKYWQLNKYHSIATRVGYKFLNDISVLAGFTCGLGYRLTLNRDLNVDVDYSYNPYGDLGDAHRISLTGKFLGPAETHNSTDKAGAARYYQEGYRLLYNKQYAEAIIKFSECLRRDRSVTAAYMGMGACFIRIDKRATAKKAYLAALETDPNNAKLKDFINSYNWGIEAQPQNQEPWRPPAQQQQVQPEQQQQVQPQQPVQQQIQKTAPQQQPKVQPQKTPAQQQKIQQKKQVKQQQDDTESGDDTY